MEVRTDLTYREQVAIAIATMSRLRDLIHDDQDALIYIAFSGMNIEERVRLLGKTPEEIKARLDFNPLVEE